LDRVFAIAKGGEGMPCHALSTRSGAGTVRVKSCVDRVSTVLVIASGNEVFSREHLEPVTPAYQHSSAEAPTELE
jgi:hypothetical protein